jgi:tRNA U54 and U55 pseudouridine synthase Pus10
MSDDLKVLPAKAVEIVKNKRTGKVYADKAEFDTDVANPNTDTTFDDFQQDLEITVASLHTKGDTQ